MTMGYLNEAVLGYVWLFEYETEPREGGEILLHEMPTQVPGKGGGGGGTKNKKKKKMIKKNYL